MLLIFISFFSIIMSICLFFRKENRKIANLHLRKLRYLKYQIKIEKSQLDRRYAYLNKYDFENYNLKDIFYAQF